MAEPASKRPRLADSEEDAGPSSGKPFVVERISERHARKYNVEEITFRAKFNDTLEGESLLDITENLHSMFQEIMEKVDTEHSSPNDKARLSIRHSGLDRDITIHCQPKHNITPDVIMERLVYFIFTFVILKP